jgi:MoxR-like ATPase
MSSVTSTSGGVGGNRSADFGEATSAEVRAQCEAFRASFAALEAEVGKVIVGHSEVVRGVLTALFAGGNVLLEGVPGLGKTLLVRTLAQALSLPFGRVQFTPDLMPADVIGTNIVTEDPGTGRRGFAFQKGPIFAQLVLADEINRATPKTQSALLEAMQERSVTVAGQTYKLELPFLVLATQNPIEQEGTYPLPEAQLDRFMLKLVVGYSQLDELMTILDRTTAGAGEGVRAVLDGVRILQMQRLVRDVVVSPQVKQYAARLVLATHPKGRFAIEMVNKYVRCGASPRGAQALVLAAKVRALVDGRFHASAKDVQAFAAAVLRHRLILNFEAEADRVDADAVVTKIVETTGTEPVKG